jgi:ActR/RegA family two-component response regulator
MIDRLQSIVERLNASASRQGIQGGSSASTASTLQSANQQRPPTYASLGLQPGSSSGLQVPGIGLMAPIPRSYSTAGDLTQARQMPNVST